MITDAVRIRGLLSLHRKQGALRAAAATMEF